MVRKNRSQQGRDYGSLAGCQKTENENGKPYPGNKTSEENKTETSNEDIVEETSSQETDISDAKIQKNWKDAYREIIGNIDENLVDPYGLRAYSNGYHYIAIHDFDNSGEPELIIGDSASVAIFTYNNGTSKKVADLYETEDWGGINGLYYKDDRLLLVSAGSDGCGYVGFTYDKGEYLTGIYDDYNPDAATINAKKVSGEEFRKRFDLTEFVESDNDPRHLKLWENAGSIQRVKIEPENKGTLKIEDKETLKIEDKCTLKIEDKEMEIDNLDFSVLQW